MTTGSTGAFYEYFTCSISENIIQCKLVLYSQNLVTLLKNYVFQTIQNNKTFSSLKIKLYIILILVYVAQSLFSFY